MPYKCNLNHWTGKNMQLTIFKVKFISCNYFFTSNVQLAITKHMYKVSTCGLFVAPTMRILSAPSVPAPSSCTRNSVFIRLLDSCSLSDLHSKKYFFLQIKALIVSVRPTRIPVILCLGM